MVWTEAEYIKKSCQEYTEQLYRKDIHDPDNHDDVITHLEPDIWKVNLGLLLHLQMCPYCPAKRS